MIEKRERKEVKKKWHIFGIGPRFKKPKEQTQLQKGKIKTLSKTNSE